ncbi:diaminopimelate epimerase [Dongia sedimenti]|uniref:Diaminopimelate epimerase n=1 Tax=Dongia sedimenti TaxID=3064282 RepID=A0ABU0YID0_9PROT|nr:diaminopimelate epimerase [Rhodospirillaceae bacterium R-7]
MRLPFTKMHGLGNDFVVIDARSRPLSLSDAQKRRIADRRRGIGCDQLIVLERSRGADVFMRIFNPDGSEAGACGNATRCVAGRLMAENGVERIVVETISGLLETRAADRGDITVDMGEARTDWRDIPVAQECDTLHLPLALGSLADPVGVNVGNPHAVFFVPDVTVIDLEKAGPELERAPLFPQRANIEFVQLLTPGRLRMRVWERGAGITQACGSGACASLVAAARRGMTGRKAEVVLDGGTLTIEWLPNNHVLMTGGWTTSFQGEIELADVPALEAVHG